jgi:hypothetical protein
MEPAAISADDDAPPRDGRAGFGWMVRRSDLIVAALRADPPAREVDLICHEHAAGAWRRAPGPPLSAHATRWRITALVAARADRDPAGAPPAVGEVIEALSAQIDTIVGDHLAFHRPRIGLTRSHPPPPRFLGGLPADHAGEMLIFLTCCQGWLAGHARYAHVVDGGCLALERRAEVEARWAQARAAKPVIAAPEPRRWWWPW